MIFSVAMQQNLRLRGYFVKKMALPQDYFRNNFRSRAEVKGENAMKEGILMQTSCISERPDSETSELLAKLQGGVLAWMQALRKDNQDSMY